MKLLYASMNYLSIKKALYGSIFMIAWVEKLFKMPSWKAGVERFQVLHNKVSKRKSLM